MRTLTTTIYKFSELSESAKRKALEKNWDWNIHDDWHEFSQDDFAAIGAILGVEFDTRSIPLMSGKTRQEPKIYYSGFSSQGDGASFAGRWTYSKGMARKIREHAPKDAEIHRIADNLTDIQRRYFYGIDTRIEQRGNYCHSNTMHFGHYHNRDIELPASVTDEIEQLLRDLADWYYSQLSNEYDYLTSDAAIAESLECNEVEFDEDGNHA